MIVQLLLILGPISWCVPVWLAFGFLGTSSIIAYSALSQSFPVHLSGRVTTAVNLLVFITAFVAQWALGGIIDIFTKGATALAPAWLYRRFFPVAASPAGGNSLLCSGWSKTN